MKLADCEISHLHVRGCNVALIIGDRKVSDKEWSALRGEFESIFGTLRAVAYVSRDGWQVPPGDSEPVTTKRDEDIAAPPPAPAESTATDTPAPVAKGGPKGKA